MSKHTPGPWLAVCGHWDETVNIKVQGKMYIQEITEADERLILAAPEMLDALKRVVYEQNSFEIHDLCKAVLKKAEGVV